MITAAILTISDKGSTGEREDLSGPAISSEIEKLNIKIIEYAIVPDEKSAIITRLKDWADSGKMDIIFTTGGTGLARRDVTPEATMAVIDREIPGLAEVMRARSMQKTPMAALSRAVAGLRGSCLIINLPGSPRAVHECLEAIMPALPHAVEIIKGVVTEHTAG